MGGSRSQQPGEPRLAGFGQPGPRRPVAAPAVRPRPGTPVAPRPGAAVAPGPAPVGLAGAGRALGTGGGGGIGVPDVAMSRTAGAPGSPGAGQADPGRLVQPRYLADLGRIDEREDVPVAPARPVRPERCR